MSKSDLFYIDPDGILRLKNSDIVHVDGQMKNLQIGKLHKDDEVLGLLCYYKSLHLLYRHNPSNPDHLIVPTVPNIYKKIK